MVRNIGRLSKSVSVAVYGILLSVRMNSLPNVSHKVQMYSLGRLYQPYSKTSSL